MRSAADDAPTIQLTLARFAEHDRAEWITQAASVLSPAELERVAAITDLDSRTQHALGRALIRLAGAQEAGCHPRRLTVAVSEQGRPYLVELPHLHVNVSHARGAVVMAIASCPVGVDIEDPRVAAPQQLRLAERFFAPAEVGRLRELPADQMTSCFARLWTIKEAVGKALGVGVIPVLSQVVAEPEAAGLGPEAGLPSDPELRLAHVAAGPPAESWTLHQLIAPGGRERIAVASPTAGLALAPISILTLEHFTRAMPARGRRPPAALPPRTAGPAHRRAGRRASRAARPLSNPTA